LDVLIRKQTGTIAKTMRKSAARLPLAPNRGLKAAPGEKKPLCAAEMTSKTAIFKHLNGTSLLTAPVFSREELDQLNLRRFIEQSGAFLSSEMLG
jgi:hypothetical protein